MSVLKRMRLARRASYSSLASTTLSVVVFSSVSVLSRSGVEGWNDAIVASVPTYVVLQEVWRGSREVVGM